MCGTPSKGNWITGYYLPCVSEHDARTVALDRKLDFFGDCFKITECRITPQGVLTVTAVKVPRFDEQK